MLSKAACFWGTQKPTVGVPNDLHHGLCDELYPNRDDNI